MMLAPVHSVLPDLQPGIAHLLSLLVLLATFHKGFIITWTFVMWKLLDPVIKILSCEVLHETSILWIKDVILKELICDWQVVKTAQRERAMHCRTCVTEISKVSI